MSSSSATIPTTPHFRRPVSASIRRSVTPLDRLRYPAGQLHDVFRIQRSDSFPHAQSDASRGRQHLLDAREAHYALRRRAPPRRSQHAVESQSARRLRLHRYCHRQRICRFSRRAALQYHGAIRRSESYFRSWGFDLYAQDDFRVTKTFTASIWPALRRRHAAHRARQQHRESRHHQSRSRHDRAARRIGRAALPDPRPLS